MNSAADANPNPISPRCTVWMCVLTWMLAGMLCDTAKGKCLWPLFSIPFYSILFHSILIDSWLQTKLANRAQHVLAVQSFKRKLSKRHVKDHNLAEHSALKIETWHCCGQSVKKKKNLKEKNCFVFVFRMRLLCVVENTEKPVYSFWWLKTRVLFVWIQFYLSVLILEVLKFFLYKNMNSCKNQSEQCIMPMKM